ncbi:hypothetical protein H8D30_04820 [bacterium]|nr:hypothetical protein [bacterium]
MSPPLSFEIEEGGSKNAFLKDGEVAVHVETSRGSSRLVVALVLWVAMVFPSAPAEPRPGGRAPRLRGALRDAPGETNRLPLNGMRIGALQDSLRDP